MNYDKQEKIAKPSFLILLLITYCTVQFYPFLGKDRWVSICKWAGLNGQYLNKIKTGTKQWHKSKSWQMTIGNSQNAASSL